MSNDNPQPPGPDHPASGLHEDPPTIEQLSEALANTMLNGGSDEDGFYITIRLPIGAGDRAAQLGRYLAACWNAAPHDEGETLVGLRKR